MLHNISVVQIKTGASLFTTKSSVRRPTLLKMHNKNQQWLNSPSLTPKNTKKAKTNQIQILIVAHRNSWNLWLDNAEWHCVEYSLSPRHCGHRYATFTVSVSRLLVRLKKTDIALNSTTRLNPRKFNFSKQIRNKEKTLNETETCIVAVVDIEAEKGRQRKPCIREQSKTPWLNYWN